MSYLISGGKLVARTSLELKSGDVVTGSEVIIKERLDASREHNLVNQRYLTVSNAKRWDKSRPAYYARPINESTDEFQLLDLRD